MAASDIEIMQQACDRVGIDRITSKTQPGRRATILTGAYETKVRARLCSHGAWKFATGVVQLEYQAENTFGIWRYAYDEPVTSPAKLINHGVYPADPTSTYSDYTRKRQIPHDVNNGTILTNCKLASDGSGLVLLYGFRAAEADWSPKFTDAFVTELTAVLLASPIKNDMAGAREKQAEADRMFLDAAATDAEQVTRSETGDHQLIDMWVSGIPSY